MIRSRHETYELNQEGFLIHKIKLLAPMLVFMIGYMIWFTRLESATGVHYHIIHAALDDLIPFCEYFIIPYYSWFIFVPVFLLYVLFVNEAIYRPVSYILMVGMLIFLIVSTIYPTMLDLRPDQIPSGNFFCRLVAHLYATDTPTNVNPSIHVFNTLTGIFAVFSCKSSRPKDQWFRSLVLVWAVLIILSTVFLKQHSVWDLLASGIMFIALYALFQHIPSINHKEMRKKHENT